MGRVVLHLLGSLVLGVILLGVAELMGRTEVHAGTSKPVTVRLETPATPTIPAVTGKHTLYDRCWELMGINRVVPTPSETRPAAVRPHLSFGWEYLPPHLIGR